MNHKEVAESIVKTIESFPKVYDFLVKGDTGCHPQHLGDCAGVVAVGDGEG